MAILYISPTEAHKRLMAKKQNALLLDIRRPEEIQTIRTRDPFVAIPMSRIKSRIQELDPRTRTYVICRSGRRAIPVTEYLLQMDFDAVYIVQGGIIAWAAELGPDEVITHSSNQ